MRPPDLKGLTPRAENPTTPEKCEPPLALARAAATPTTSRPHSSPGASMYDSVDINGVVINGNVSSIGGTTATTDVLTLLGTGGSIAISAIETVLGSTGTDA